MKRLALVLALAACQKASDTDKQMPKLPPPPQVHIREDLRIAVEIDGQPAPPIDAARLAAIKPDFVDDEHKAWRFRTLLGPTADRPGTVLAITGPKDIEVALRPPKNENDPVPVLTVSRRGDVVVAMVSPSDPFPNYHGQGRRMNRPGDPLPRIPGVTKVRVFVETAATQASLAVVVDGKPGAPWTRDQLDKVPPLFIHAEGGAERDAWSLRTLADKLVGPGARVVELRAEGTRKIAIAPKAWADPGRMPVLRLNREGQFKFQWVDTDGTAVEGGELRNVRAVVLERKP